jgi:hypothetical protein
MKRAGSGPSSNAGIWQLYEERYEAQRAGSGPSSNAGIWHLYKEQYEAQQSQTAKAPPLSTLLPPSPTLVTLHPSDCTLEAKYELEDHRRISVSPTLRGHCERRARSRLANSTILRPIWNIGQSIALVC